MSAPYFRFSQQNDRLRIGTIIVVIEYHLIKELIVMLPQSQRARNMQLDYNLPLPAWNGMHYPVSSSLHVVMLVLKGHIVAKPDFLPTVAKLLFDSSKIFRGTKHEFYSSRFFHTIKICILCAHVLPYPIFLSRKKRYPFSLR